MIVIKLGEDKYEFEGSEQDYESLSQRFRVNVQQIWIEVPKSMTGDRRLTLQLKNITSFYYEEKVVSNVGDEPLGEITEKKRAGRPKKVNAEG